MVVEKEHAHEEQPVEKRWDDRVHDLWKRFNYEQHQSPSSSLNNGFEVKLDEGVTYFPQGDYWGFEKWQMDSLDSDLHSLAIKEKQARLQIHVQHDEQEQIATPPPPDDLPTVDIESASNSLEEVGK